MLPTKPVQRGRGQNRRPNPNGQKVGELKTLAIVHLVRKSLDKMRAGKDVGKPKAGNPTP